MKGLRLYLIGGAVIFIIYLIAQYYQPKPTDWRPTYLKEDKIPFGLYILHQQLGDVFKHAAVRTSTQRIYNTLKDQHYKNSSYLMINGAMNLDALDFKELVAYMKQGNHVFIASYSLGKVLSDTLKLETSSGMGLVNSKSKGINFVNPLLKANKPYIFDKDLSGQFFSTFDTARVTVLGRNVDGAVNFIKYTFGKGNLYLLPNPQLLTNYSLITLPGATYAAKALSYLPASQTIIWDESYTRGDISDKSILRVIFKHDALRWAYYLSLAGLLLFVAFEVKRRQRIIPVVTPLANSSVEFAKVVGKVYYQQRDNGDIARKKINYFLEYIRTSYRLKTNNLDEELMENLALRSGAQPKTIQQVMVIINAINNSASVSDEQLISLNKLIEEFYKQVQ